MSQVVNKIRNSINCFDLTISVFFSIVSFIVAHTFFVGRSGFTNPYSIIFNTIGICGFVFLLPCFVTILITHYSRRDYSIIPGFTAITTLAAILFLVLISYLVPFVGSWLAFPWIVLGYIFLLVAIILLIFQQGIVQMAQVLIFVALFVMWFAGRVYSDVYHDPMFLENMVVGIIKLDPLFHISIAEMIKTYGIPSTGLNGTPYIGYHWGSHWLFAQFSTLLHTSVLNVYHLLYPALFLPLYFKVLLTCSYDICLFKGVKAEKVVFSTFFWVAFLILQIGFLPYTFLSNWAMSESWVESESYSISLALLFLIISISLGLYKYISFSNSVKLLLMVTIPLGIGFVGLLKSSTMILAAAALGYLFIKLQFFRNKLYTITFLSTLLISYYIYQLTISSYADAETDFYPFHFLKTQVIDDWRGLFFYFHYFWSILYIFLRLNQQNITTPIKLKQAFLENKLLDVELILLISLLGFMPGFVYAISGGSAYYFSDVQARIATVLIIRFLLSSQVQSPYYFSALFKKIALLIPVVICLLLNNIFSKIEDGINRNLNNRLNLVRSCNMETTYMQNRNLNIIEFISVYPKQLLNKLEELKTAPTKCLENNTFYLATSQLHQISLINPKEKKNKHLYMAEIQDWFLSPGPVEKKSAPFIFPALTGISLIGGVPKEFVSIGYNEYGYQSYLSATDTLLFTRGSVKMLCDYINYKNFQNKEVFIINKELFITDTLRCVK